MPPKKKGRPSREEVFVQFIMPTCVSDLGGLSSPADVQRLLDTLPYNTDHVTRCPKAALEAGKIRCLDGALLAAAALRRMGHPPQIVFLNALDDDGHAVALFEDRAGGTRCLGAVGKSNFVGLRYREPVYASLRELIMSYFEHYYNSDGRRTLRSYSEPLDLTAFDPMNWETDQAAVKAIEKALYRQQDHVLMTLGQVRNLNRVDERSYHAGMVGINMEGVYTPKT